MYENVECALTHADGIAVIAETNAVISESHYSEVREIL